MVYGAIQRHGGVLEVRSEPDEGTVIDVYLPLLLENVKEALIEKVQMMDGQGEVVLLVDDDEMLFDTTEEVLTGAELPCGRGHQWLCSSRVFQRASR